MTSTQLEEQHQAAIIEQFSKSSKQQVDPAPVPESHDTTQENKLLKLVLVGDTSVGKSCLIRNYLENQFSENYEPTVLDVYRGTKNIKRRQIDIEIHDTSGDENLGVNRQIQYRGADIFMICYAANSPESL